jgi:hypothetical protein
MGIVERAVRRLLKGPPLSQRLRQFGASVTAPLPERETDLVPEVLINTYNHAAYLADAIASAAATGFRLTVVDDASTDDTPLCLIGLPRVLTSSASTTPPT